MIKTTLKIEGMMCSMCEAHINDVIRKAVPGAKKVSSSHGCGREALEKRCRRDGLYLYVCQFCTI